MSIFPTTSTKRHTFGMLWRNLWFFPTASGVARGRQGGNHPLAETLPPPCPPNEITFCTEVYGEPPFWIPVSLPAHSSAPLAAPSFWKVWLRACQQLIIKYAVHWTHIIHPSWAKLVSIHKTYHIPSYYHQREKTFILGRRDSRIGAVPILKGA